ncbi:and nb-arc domain containing protein [Grosmannia clavigera kw1407]|uniref:Riboflavin kinase n=1 Tax=Grosmannia clavigera (strain kw1407 / UAMH 11150) TaxID=655863 RepID=F0XNT2_GROCL|nr:and nb-arc domain containing protein [Grosmannia clavigera kw1407]EFX00375.1 and nb-arc domain containing protein [Grosmannia clavigera kw1407]
MDYQWPQQGGQAIQRKAISRRPVAQRSADVPEKSLLRTPDATSDAGPRVDDSELAGPKPSQFLTQRRQQTTTMTMGSSASSTPTWATTASTISTDSTAASSVMTSGSLSAPVLAERPRTATYVGQYGPGFGQTAASSHSGHVSDDETGKGKGKDKDKGPSFWKTALDETRFFAGGLVQKPFESTKHYTIMRHSSWLILYRGPATSVAVTVFSTAKHALPADRTVWLQQRGFSGDAGLRLKTLVGASGSWLDVTPEREATASELPAVDERGYERDISRLLKRAEKHGEKALAKRQVRETLVVRIPAAAQDGYFRLVVCSGGPTTAVGGAVTKRKVLCGCPVFRVASTSTDASIFRGASLRTLPLEAGVKLVSVIGSNAVAAWTEPVVTVVQDKVQKYQPGTASTLAATEAYDQSGMQQRLERAGEMYSESRETAYSVWGADKAKEGEKGDEDEMPDMVGADAGPEKPFPQSIQGRVVRGTGRSSGELGVPTANLDGVSDDVRLRMRGLYFGWATVRLGDKAGDEDQRVSHDWIEALVVVGPSPWAPAAAVVPRSEVAVHVLYDFGGASLLGRRLDVVVMGFLRGLSSGDGGAAAALGHDARVAVTSLSRPRWGQQAALAQMQSEKARGLTDRMAESRGRFQKQVDRIPAHWVGVRTAGGEMRDQLYGNGGFFVKRG